MKRWAVPAVPFAISLCLSLCTVGTHAYWQDSGLYLTAVKDLGVLYPPGFVLYEMLCVAWTRIFFFLDFTLAVHLFSSVCAASAAAVMAVAIRDLLRSRGPLFQVTEQDSPDLTDACGMLVGVLLACGYTFWSGAIYAKGYSFYYLILALLIWRMIRADESGTRRDLLITAGLIGLAWQAHPSAALAGLCFLLFAVWKAKTLTLPLVGQAIGTAALCALGPSLLLLPILVSREPAFMMGHPQGLGELLKYFQGRVFLSVPGAFGLEASRVAGFGLFFWEEFLGIGSLLLLAGLAALAKRRGRLLVLILAWLIPYATLTILFKLEGQHDYWFVAAWMPLHLVVGAGAWLIGSRAGPNGRLILLGLGVAATGWAVLANLGDLQRRDDVLAETYGRTILEPVDQDALLLVGGDDVIGMTSYLQRIRGVRTDVLLVTSNYLNSAGSRWYDDLLLRRHSFLRSPDYGSLEARAAGLRPRDVATAAFLNENAECGRSLFCEQIVPLDLLRPDFTLVPAGATWKLVRRDAKDALDLRYWKFPMEPEQVPSRSGRARGLKAKFGPGTLSVESERYEERLKTLIVMARFHLAMALTEKGQFAAAAKLCGSILALDPKYGESPEIVHHYGISLHAAGEDAHAEPALRRSAEISVNPRSRATACFYVGEILRRKGAEDDALQWFGRALSTPGLDEPTRRQIESRIKRKG